jgi:hypothetical protein
MLFCIFWQVGGADLMPKRLGYKTDACMMLIRREINEHMINEKINKSGLVNDLLLKWYEHKLCPTCLGGVIRSAKCKQCNAGWIMCNNNGKACQDNSYKVCECEWDDVHGF